MTPNAVVLVEGPSDRIAIETLAARRGRDLAAEGVTVVAIGGAQAIERTLRGLSGVRVAGLYDVAEERDVLRGLERAGRGADGFFACDPDLEGELVRALGTGADARARRGARAAGQRSPPTGSSRRSARSHSRRSYTAGCTTGRSATRPPLVEALDLDRVPRPLEQVLAHVATAC